MTLSRMIVVLRQIGFSSVFETTYFLGGFIRSPNGSPGGMGSNASACVTYVRRPSRNASVSFISATKLLPMSSCQYGIVQPPCSNPPSRSSSLPPGACITPSSVTNSDTISFRMETVPVMSLDRYAELAVRGTLPAFAWAFTRTSNEHARDRHGRDVRQISHYFTGIPPRAHGPKLRRAHTTQGPDDAAPIRRRARTTQGPDDAGPRRRRTQT